MNWNPFKRPKDKIELARIQVPGIREYQDGEPVVLCHSPDIGRYVIVAMGHASVVNVIESAFKDPKLGGIIRVALRYKYCPVYGTVLNAQGACFLCREK